MLERVVELHEFCPLICFERRAVHEFRPERVSVWQMPGHRLGHRLAKHPAKSAESSAKEGGALTSESAIRSLCGCVSIKIGDTPRMATVFLLVFLQSDNHLKGYPQKRARHPSQPERAGLPDNWHGLHPEFSTATITLATPTGSSELGGSQPSGSLAFQLLVLSGWISI